MNRIVISNKVTPHLWYEDMKGKDFYVKNYNEDLYIIPGTNKVLIKSDCEKFSKEVLEKIKMQKRMKELDIEIKNGL